jgi:predicted double-glycine peptidase
MNQRTINRMVARATGEELRNIRRMGFTIADPARVQYDPDSRAGRGRMIDWDDLQNGLSQEVNLQRPFKRLA